jgi:hypothetical protein
MVLRQVFSFVGVGSGVDGVRSSTSFFGCVSQYVYCTVQCFLIGIITIAIGKSSELVIPPSFLHAVLQTNCKAKHCL